ncbi:MAG: ATP synthase F1 subunit delta [Tissierellia bacterium]|nr:ATP synthase F1 subunit delta [Tissierellia bacterium]
MAKLVAIPYAKALFDAGLDLGKLKDMNDDVHLIEDVFNSEDKLIQILSHPHIGKSEKKVLMKKILGANISEYTLNFLYILIDKRREKDLFHIIKEFGDLYDDYIGVLRVVAVTAIEMEDKSKGKLVDILHHKLNKEIILTNEVDETILGGVLLKLDNKFMDSTILGELKSMESYIKAI